SIPAPSVIPVLIVPDVRAAVAWLGEVFGFVERLQIGEGHRSQLMYGDAAVIVAEVHGERVAPAGEATHQVLLRVDDVDAVCERARAHGARIVSEPTTFPYGERQCEIADPAGHRWMLSQTVEDVDPADWGGILRG